MEISLQFVLEVYEIISLTSRESLAKIEKHEGQSFLRRKRRKNLQNGRPSSSKPVTSDLCSIIQYSFSVKLKNLFGTGKNKQSEGARSDWVTRAVRHSHHWFRYKKLRSGSGTPLSPRRLRNEDAGDERQIEGQENGSCGSDLSQWWSWFCCCAASRLRRRRNPIMNTAADTTPPESPSSPLNGTMWSPPTSLQCGYWCASLANSVSQGSEMSTKIRIFVIYFALSQTIQHKYNKNNNNSVLETLFPLNFK